MRMKIPITGTVIAETPVAGDPDDPIRVVNIDLGNVSWKLVRLDLDAELMEIEVTPSERISENTGEVDEEGNPISRSRKTTVKEREAFVEYARNHSLEKMSKQALYALSRSPRLKRRITGGEVRT